MSNRYLARVFVSSLLIGLMCLGPSPMLAAEQAARASARPADAAPASEMAIDDPLAHLADARQQIQRQLRAMMAIYRAQPGAAYTPAALLARLDSREPADLHRHVHAQTHPVPYLGSLRGAGGVIVDGTGNSLDRALLLGGLLKEAGYETRLVHGQLDDEAVDAFWDATRKRQREPGLPVSEPLSMSSIDPQQRDEVDARVARALEITPEALRQRRAATRVQRQRTYEDAINTASGQAMALRDMIAGHRIAHDDPERAAGTNEPTTDARRDHWWVEWRSPDTDAGAGAEWSPLDPGREPNRADEPWSAPEQRYALDDASDDALPDTLRHHVTIEIVAEQWSVDGLEERVALRERVEPRDLIVEHIQFLCTPTGFSLPAQDAEEIDDPVAVMKQALIDQREWLPVLIIGDNGTTQSAIRTDGSLNENPARTPTGRAMGEAAGALGALSLGGRDDTPESQLSALHLDFIVHAPGRDEVRHRRTIMDVLGEARRHGETLGAPKIDNEQAVQRALGLLTQTQTLILPGRMPVALAEHIALVNQINDSHRMAQAIAAIERDRDDDAVDALSRREPVPAPLYAWTALRSAWSPHRGQWFADEPVIANLHTLVSINADGLMQTRLGMDVVNNPATPGPAFEGEPFALRLTQGVLDTALEGVALHREAVTMRRNTAALWEAAQTTGVGWSADQAYESWPEDARVRVRRERERALVVAPSDPVRVGGGDEIGWWRIDPVTGRTLGYGIRGWGQELTEYHMVRTYGSTAQKALLQMKLWGMRAAIAGHGAAQKYGLWLMALCVLCTGVTMSVLRDPEVLGVACDFHCQAFGPA